MTKSERITEYILRAVAAPIMGLLGAVAVMVLAFSLLALMEWLGSPAFVCSLAREAASMVMGFAFVFVGSRAATTPWRVRAACILVAIGMLFYWYFHYCLLPDSDSKPGPVVSVWAALDLAVTIAGGLSAAAVLRFRKHEKTS